MYKQRGASFMPRLSPVIAPDSIKIDPSKVSAVFQWPTPTDRKQVQHFAFANFYRRFIRNFSSIAALLHALISPNVKFLWSPQAELPFQTLKKCFTTAPILSIPNLKLQFVVEVDASDVGVGSDLCQHSSKDNKLHPCAYLFCYYRAKLRQQRALGSSTERMATLAGGN